MSDRPRRSGSPYSHLDAWRELTPEQLAAWSGFLWTHARVVRALDAQLERAHGLALASFDVLFQLSIADDERLLVSELADAIVLDPSGLGRVVDRLAASGLVEHGPTDGDPDAAYVRVTERGRALLADAAQTHVAGIKAEFLTRLSEQQTEQLAVICDALLGP
jgi:DNA-binding MarR family transcriptional regulator